MRLSEEQVKQGILHDDPQVRLAALEFFAKAFSRDTTVMPVAIAAFERFGRTGAFSFTHPISELVQTPETIQWAIAELQANNDQSENGLYFRNSLGRLLCEADPDLLLPHETEILDVLTFNADLAQQFARRLQVHRLDDEACWREIETICEAGKDKLYASDARFSEAQDLAQTLARRGERHADRMMATLAEEITDLENNPMVWLEPLMVYMAGEMRYEPAVPLVIGKLHEDGDILNEECQYALIKIGTDSVIRGVGQAFPSAEWHFRLYASGVLGRVHSDLAVETCSKLLETERENAIRTQLAEALAEQFSSEGNELARKVLLETPPWPADLKTDLVMSCTLLGQYFPELERWRQDIRQAHRRMLKWDQSTSDLGVNLSNLDSVRRIDQGGSTAAPSRSTKTPGRNDPCPCGSGKKYKSCCMRKQTIQ